MADHATLNKKRLKSRKHSVLIAKASIKGLKLSVERIVSQVFQGRVVIANAYTTRQIGPCVMQALESS